MYLLDTHVLLWWLRETNKISDRVDVILSDASEPIYVSAITFYEIHLKIALGKLMPLHADLGSALAEIGFASLSLTPQDATIAAQLPQLHRDPWDRLLVAQANRLGFKLISKDTQLDTLGADRLW